MVHALEMVFLQSSMTVHLLLYAQSIVLSFNNIQLLFWQNYSTVFRGFEYVLSIVSAYFIEWVNSSMGELIEPQLTYRWRASKWRKHSRMSMGVWRMDIQHQNAATDASTTWIKHRALLRNPFQSSHSSLVLPRAHHNWNRRMSCSYGQPQCSLCPSGHLYWHPDAWARTRRGA